MRRRVGLSGPAIAASSSTARTERPSATIRAAICSCCAAVGKASNARAWPALRTPAATRRWTVGGRLSSRIVLVMCERDVPIRRAELLVGAAEVVEQLGVGGRLLQRVQLLAMQVLQQRVAQHRLVGGLANDGRDLGELGELGRPPAALTHDELVVLAAERAHDDRLQQPDLADAGGELLQRLLVEVLPGLAAVRGDPGHGDHAQLPDDGAAAVSPSQGSPALPAAARRGR